MTSVKLNMLNQTALKKAVEDAARPAVAAYTKGLNKMAGTGSVAQLKPKIRRLMRQHGITANSRQLRQTAEMIAKK